MTPLTLKHWFLINAAFSTACAVDMLLFAPKISHWLGLLNHWIIPALALGLLLFAGLLFWLSRLPAIPKPVALSIVLADCAWVIASAMFVILNPTHASTIGLGLVIAIACIVGSLAAFQFRSARRECALIH